MTSNNVIVDVGIAHDGEKLPYGWERVERSVQGGSADLNSSFSLFGGGKKVFLCFKRGQPNVDQEIVTGVIVFFEGKTQIPEQGFRVQTKSITATKSGNMNYRGGGDTAYLCVRKAHRSMTSWGLQNVVVIRKHETPPPNYTVLDGDINARGEKIRIGVLYTQLSPYQQQMPPQPYPFGQSSSFSGTHNGVYQPPTSTSQASNNQQQAGMTSGVFNRRSTFPETAPPTVASSNPVVPPFHQSPSARVTGYSNNSNSNSNSNDSNSNNNQQFLFQQQTSTSMQFERVEVSRPVGMPSLSSSPSFVPPAHGNGNGQRGRPLARRQSIAAAKTSENLWLSGVHVSMCSKYQELGASSKLSSLRVSESATSADSADTKYSYSFETEKGLLRRYVS